MKPTTRLFLKNKYKSICSAAKIILLDIEGTTTPISFVTQILFPYAKSNLEKFLVSKYNTKEVKDSIKSLQNQCQDDITNKLYCKQDFVKLDLNKSSKEKVLEHCVDYIMWLMANDRKVTPLKQLQGDIWQSAYEVGDIKGDIFSDVKPAIDIARNVGKLIYIYSSGSVAAQKLLFKYSVDGNLLPLINGHFDTKIGDKKCKDSYIKIAKNLKVQPCDILFLTDVAAEADAALLVGYKVFIVSRPGNKSIPNLYDYDVISDFSVLSSCFS